MFNVKNIQTNFLQSILIICHNFVYCCYSASKACTILYKTHFTLSISDCQLQLKPQEGTVTNKHLSLLPTTGCQIWFPSQESGHGLVIELTKLNVPCSKGFVHFSGLNTSQHQLHLEKGYGEIYSTFLPYKYLSSSTKYYYYIIIINKISGFETTRIF